MIETYKVLGQLNPIAATLTDLYVVPADTQAVGSSIMVANRSAVKTEFRIAIAVGGVADDLKQYIAFDFSIFGNDPQEFTIGITLQPTDVVRVYATLATLSFNMFGTEIT